MPATWHGPGRHQPASKGRVNVWRPVDWLAEWLTDRFTPRNQLRLGIVLFLASLPLLAYTPWTSEPKMVYAMSAVAITLTGVTIVFAAEVLLRQEEQ